MGIADRDYSKASYRGGGGGGRRVYMGPSFKPRNMSVIGWLIIINVAIFAVDQFLPLLDIQDVTGMSQSATQEQIDRSQVIEVTGRAKPHIGVPWRKPIVDPLTLDANGSPQIIGYEQYRTWHALNGLGHFSVLKGFMAYEVWRVVTYQFLHADFSHLFFNMFGLFMFGAAVEQYLGKKRFLSFYLICGIAGGIMYLLIVALGRFVINLPGELAQITIGTPLIGASAGVFGVIVASVKVRPRDTIDLILIPQVPIAVVAYGYVGLAMLNLLRGGSNAGGDAAHIGGAIAGFYFIRNIHLLRGFLDFGLVSNQPRGGAHPRPGAAGSNTKLQKKVDAVLDKVNREGMHSLTAREKKILERSARKP